MINKQDKYGFIQMGHETWLILSHVILMRRLYTQADEDDFTGVHRFYYLKSLEKEMEDNGLYYMIVKAMVGDTIESINDLP